MFKVPIFTLQLLHNKQRQKHEQQGALERRADGAFGADTLRDPQARSWYGLERTRRKEQL